MRWYVTNSLKAVMVFHIATAAVLSFMLVQAAAAPAQETTAPPGQPPPEQRGLSNIELYDGLIIRQITFDGLNRVSPETVSVQIRSSVGEPLSFELVNDYDIPILTRLNLFRRVFVDAVPTNDGGVILRYTFDEWPLALDVQLVGNRTISDQELLGVIVLRPGDPLDTYQINRGREAIAQKYRERGFHLIEVSVDPEALTDSSTVVYVVREGPRARIKQVEFQGNRAFDDKTLSANLTTKAAVPFLRQGTLDNDVLAQDVRAIVDYYVDCGYLDVRVDREISLSNDLKEAKVVILVDEGRPYTLRDLRITGIERFRDDQVRALAAIRPGDVYSRTLVQKTQQAIADAYEQLGYVNTLVRVLPYRDPDQGVVDLMIEIREGELAFTGEVRVIGNTVTKREVILRESRIRPGRPMNILEIRETARRLRNVGIFDPQKIAITPQPIDPLFPRERDVIIEVEETNTGSFNFGAAISSDAGIFGTFGLTQRNFDIADFPESIREMVQGHAFRGAGQTFDISLQPGNEFSSYSISLTEPYLFATDNSLKSSALYFQRQRESYDETRWGGSFTLGRRLGEVWTLGVTSRYQSIDLHNIDADAPVDVFDVENENVVTGLGLNLVRSTVDDRFRPSRGSRIELQFEQIGLLGGDFDFTRLEAEHTVFIAVNEDFFGHKSVISMKTRVGYQFGGNTPIYERYFLGGRSLRGFDYRTVSPKGLRHDTGTLGTDPVGGDWLLFWGMQYDFPIYREALGGVFFVDTGTVINAPGIEDYRVAFGTGIRLFIPQLGQAPLAFDFGWPLLKQDGDESRLFSFSIAFPF